MPINTRNRRASAIGVLSPSVRGFPAPDGLLDTVADRQHVVGLYAGIEAEAPHAETTPSVIAAFGDHTVGQADTLTFSVTVTDAAQKIVAFVWHYDVTVAIESVTFHGDPLSEFDRAHQTYVYALGAPDVGTFDFEVVLDRSRWMGAAVFVVEDWDGQLREQPSSASDNDLMAQVISGSASPSLTFQSGADDLTLHVIHNGFPLASGFSFAEDFGQTVGVNMSPSAGNSMIGLSTSKAGQSPTVTIGYTVTPVPLGSTFVTAISLLAPDPPPEPEVPYVGINPQRGDPVGDLHFIRVNIGILKYYAAESTIRDAETPWEGMKAAELLRIGSFETALSGEGYRATTCSFVISDTPHPVTGLRRWRDLLNTETVEHALVELYRCRAPHGEIVGTPFRMWAGRVKMGGFKASSGFRFELSCVDLLGDLFSNPKNQPKAPNFRLTTEDIPNLVTQSNGKYVPRAIGQVIESGVGAVPMIPIVEDVNLFDLLGGLALNVNVDVWLLTEGAIAKIAKGYYNPPTWGSEVDVLEGDLIRPTPENRNGHVFRAGNYGVTGSTEPTWPTSGTVVDGTVTWHEDGGDDPRARYPIPDEAYSNFLTHPYAPNWTAATGRTEQYIDYPFASGTRRLIPVFTLHDHRYGQALRDGRVTLLFDVIGALKLPSSGGPILTFTDAYIRIILDYLFRPTDLTVYGDIPIYGALDGPYSVIDVASAEAAEAVGDALGGLKCGFLLGGGEGQTEGMWPRLGALLRGGSLEIGPNRHGQLMFARRDPAAEPTITFRVHRSGIDSSYHTDGSKRSHQIELRWGKRYADPFASVQSATPGDPGPASKQVIDWGWASGLQKLTNEDAFDALWESHAVQLAPIKYDNDSTFDAETAVVVGQRELDYATGPEPSYHGTMLFELTGPIDALFMSLDSNDQPREKNQVIGIIDEEGPTGDGEATTHRGRITAIRVDIESDLCTLIGEVLPPV